MRSLDGGASARRVRAQLVVRGFGPCALAGAAFFAAASSAAPAHATDFEVGADTAFQAYEVADPWGDTVLERRRYMQTLALGAYNIQGDYDPTKADYRVVMRLRLNADFGINSHLQGGQAGGETSYATQAGNGVRYVPGLDPYPVDLMYGYVEGRNIAHGLLGFKLGRQYMTDMLGWWSFDGGLVRITTPFFVQAELYGGLEQRGGLPLSTSRFEMQGIWRGSHSDFGNGAGQPSATDYPSYQFAEPAPAFGFALESNGPSFIHGRLSYRRVYNTGESITQQFPDPAPSSAVPAGGYNTISGTRISSDRVGYAIDANKSDLGGVKGGFAYDLYNEIVSSYYGGVDVYAGKHVTLGGDIDYFVPTFDADSIWNWFTHSPITTITGRTSIQFTKRFDVAVSGGIRMWTVDGDPATFGSDWCKSKGLPPNCYTNTVVNPLLFATYSQDPAHRDFTSTIDALANVAGRYKFGSGNVGFRGMMETGERGHRVGGDLSGEKGLDGGRWTVGSHVSLYDWADPLRADQNATSFGYVLAAGFKPASVADMRVEWEHEMNRLVGQRFRVVGLINLWVMK